jgi:hypothetical protein
VFVYPHMNPDCDSVSVYTYLNTHTHKSKCERGKRLHLSCFSSATLGLMRVCVYICVLKFTMPFKVTATNARAVWEDATME